MKTSNYIILIDSHEDMLGLMETSLRSFYAGEVLAWKDTFLAKETLSGRGVPFALIIDYESLLENDSEFYHYLEKQNIQIPIIAFSNKELDEKVKSQFPMLTAMMERPTSAKSFIYLMKNLIGPEVIQKSHIPVKISVLLQLGMGHFDLFLKLSEKNYVKIVNQGEPFYKSDAKKLNEKGISELYIRQEDGPGFLNLLETQVHVESPDVTEEITSVIENLEAFEQVARAMKWPPSVLISAQKSVAQAVKILSKNSQIISILQRRLQEPGSNYSKHIGLLTYLVCAFGSSLGWIGEAGQVKLAMAALIHDVAVDESLYENIHGWNNRASNSKDKEPQTIRYRMHPYEASKVLRSLDSFSPDVDQIILQHHERPNGSGFPRGLDSRRIGHLPALFIIVEDLVEFLHEGDNIETSVIDFITWGRDRYDNGHFKKIYLAFEEKLKLPS